MAKVRRHSHGATPDFCHGLLASHVPHSVSAAASRVRAVFRPLPRNEYLSRHGHGDDSGLFDAPLQRYCCNRLNRQMRPCPKVCQTRREPPQSAHAQTSCRRRTMLRADRGGPLTLRRRGGKSPDLSCTYDKVRGYRLERALAARGKSPAKHREGLEGRAKGCARLTRREEREYRAYLSDEQRSQAGAAAFECRRTFATGC